MAARSSRVSQPVAAPCANIHADLLSYSPDSLIRQVNRQGWPLAEMFEAIDRGYRSSPRLRAMASRAYGLDHLAPRPRGMARIEQDASCGEKYPNALRLALFGGQAVAKDIWASIWQEMDVDGQLTAAAKEMPVSRRAWVQAVRVIGEYRQYDPKFEKPLCTLTGSNTTDEAWATEVIGRLDDRLMRRARKYNWPVAHMLSAIKRAYDQTPGAVAKARVRVDREKQQHEPWERSFRKSMTFAWKELWLDLRRADSMQKKRRPRAVGGPIGLGRPTNRDWLLMATAVGRREAEPALRLVVNTSSENGADIGKIGQA